MTKDREEHLRKILNPADSDYCGDLLDIEDARWLLTALDEARATIARLEAERDEARAGATAFFDDGVAIRGRLRAVTEALMQAPRIETVRIVDEFKSWKCECGMFVRSEDVAAALRLREGAREREEPR